jgi:integrase
MALKKVNFEENEESIFDEAVIYTRGRYWQFRMWLTKERKYARFSLKTTNRNTAIDKAKLHYHELMSKQLAGKTYFSITTKMAVEEYIKHRQKDVEGETIVKGRLGTIKIHLQHWLEFIGKDTKVKELECTDCEYYFYERNKGKKKTSISQSTILNEQSTINAMMKWLHKKNESHISSFDFKKLPRIDKNDKALRRATFTREEVGTIQDVIVEYMADAKKNLDNKNNVTKVLAGYFLLIAGITGLRSGEQRQLTWKDIRWEEAKKKETDVSLVKIEVRRETTKVRKSREFYVRDWEYLHDLSNILMPRHKAKPLANNFIFSDDGETTISKAAVLRHFYTILELADIEDRDKRNLVPYSFRHYFITDRIKSGLSFRQISDMCGTSVTQIENTYYHVDKEVMITNALADYMINANGEIVTL